MTELQLTLTADERQFLVEFLENMLKETRVEEHRTRSPLYRENVLQREDLIAAVLKKIRPQ